MCHCTSQTPWLELNAFSSAELRLDTHIPPGSPDWPRLSMPPCWVGHFSPEARSTYTVYFKAVLLNVDYIGPCGGGGTLILLKGAIDWKQFFHIPSYKVLYAAYRILIWPMFVLMAMAEKRLRMSDSHVSVPSPPPPPG